jgi:hypothetical protein
MTRHFGILTHDFIEKADFGEYSDGSALWFVRTRRGRRYELRDAGDRECIGDAAKMTLAQARERAADLLDEIALDRYEQAHVKPLTPAGLQRYMTSWAKLAVEAA